MGAKLDRLPPADWVHVEKYPLSAAPVTKPTPVVLGINWYDAFDDPELADDGRWWIRAKNLGSIRGGHCLTVKSKQPDQLGWYRFYDQGEEGACVGFGVSRAMTMLNRVTYDAFWLYHEAQKMDEWPGEDYDGTSVRAGLGVAATKGLKRLPSGDVAAGDGISAYRWTIDVEEVHRTIGLPLADQLEAVPLVNSWGAYYPHVTWLPDSVLERLLREDGEAAVITDR